MTVGTNAPGLPFGTPEQVGFVLDGREISQFLVESLLP